MTDIDSEGEYQEYDRGFYQRLNQANSAAGAPAVMPEHHAAIAALAEKFDADIGLELLYDRDPVARRIAGHMVRRYVESDLTHRSPVIDELCPESEATLYALGARIPPFVMALKNLDQLADVQKDMASLWRCDANINRRCGLRVGGMNAEYPVHFLPIKRGERICVFTACTPCLEHIKTGLGFNDDYIGPDHDWVDDRQLPLPEPERGIGGIL